MLNLDFCGGPLVAMYVKLLNLFWYKTSFVSGQVLHILSRLQN